MHAKAKEEKPRRPKETTSESIGSIASVLVCGLFIITFVIQAFEIPSGSMENTLLIGDHVFVDRIGPTARAAYMGPLMPYRPIRHNDIIVFLHPDPAQAGMYVVKRIVGIPGDRIHLRDGKLFVNGVAQNEPYLNPEKGFFYAYRDNFPEVPPFGIADVRWEWQRDLQSHIQGDDLVVPDGYYFGMGDNRAQSLDSRYWGFIPKENIIGRPLFIYWSFDTPRDQFEHTSLYERAKFIVYIFAHFFGETRWDRAFHAVR